ncbi:zinc finger protein 648-like [Myxocyprinus asiaticus]|uniref:zinc finger protein 648-like n=1 Tax=Myxocyprinus asiaticus TaxID=70543 RepID=UPI002221898B|nr:zinc finger protein 648-like [Myxocyprinus asiaticus]
MAMSMAKMNDHLNSAVFTDNVYISKRSIRKILSRKRQYVPVKCNNTDHDTMKASLNPPRVEETNASTSCDERETIKTSIEKKMVSLHLKTQAKSYFSERCSEQSSGEERGVNEADRLGSDPYSLLEVASISKMKVKQEVDITKPCALAVSPKEQHGTAGDKCEVEEDEKDGPNPPQKKGQFVFAAMKKRGMEGDMENRPYKCTYCNWAFKKYSNLLSHIDTHRGLKPHVCDMCGKAYSHQGTLQQHKRLHTGERPYQCPFCVKSYIWSSDFRKHIRTHTGEKPYTCEECGKDFVRSSDLRKHERNMHTNNKPFLCKQCGKTFNKPLSLLRHERTHLGERPFICPECGKAFAVASRMTEHRKIHSGVRPYTCPVCFKAFTKSSNLSEHLTVHSGVRPHKCSECGVAFAMVSRLVRHQRIHATVQPYHCQGCDMSFSHLEMLTEHIQGHADTEICIT